jgi:hypothetical protein
MTVLGGTQVAHGIFAERPAWPSVDEVVSAVSAYVE